MRPLIRRDRPLESRGERFRRALARVLGGRFVKEQRAYAVELGGTTVKRLVLPDSRTAERIGEMLERVRPTGAAAAPLSRDGRELWLEFIQGASVSSSDSALVSELADLLAKLWAVAPRQQDPRACGLVLDLQRDLDFLAGSGVLTQDTGARLWKWIQPRIPDSLWLGVDYTDLRAANLLRVSDGSLRIVDVESLSSGVPLGTSLAKASIGWLEPHASDILEALVARGAPDVRAEYDFVSLVFLARWQKRSVLRGKWKRVDPELFAQRFDLD